MNQGPDLVKVARYESRLLLGFCAAVLVSVLGSRWLPSQWPVLPLALAAIAIAIWHGAFDSALAQEHFEPRWGSRWRPTFYLSYLVLAAAVACMWWVSPMVALCAFLLYSAVHFGTELDGKLSAGRLLFATAAGFVPIAAACYWWPGSVSPIFTMMLRREGRYGLVITAIAGHLLWPVVAVAVLGALHRPAYRATTIVSIVAELVLFRWCSPIAAFAVFFCLWHTPEHMLSTSLGTMGRFDLDKLKQHLQRGLPAWMLSILGIVAVCWFGRHQVEAYSAALFIVLSALTVPHMVLAELCRGNQDISYPSEAPLATRKMVTVHGN